jgi:galactokinase
MGRNFELIYSDSFSINRTQMIANATQAESRFFSEAKSRNDQIGVISGRMGHAKIIPK